jgi:aspartyl-tRNA(Asn)/glutamyl-tRNA(Gln) amidotransferase subunit C
MPAFGTCGEAGRQKAIHHRRLIESDLTGSNLQWILAMELSREDVRKVANLARLKVTDEELDALATDLRAIVGYVQVLNEVDSIGVEPMVHAVELQNVLRSDVLAESLSRPAALSNAPRTDGEYFLVPAIIETE